MKPDSESLHSHDPDLQLERLGRRCRSLAPALYREQALYFQIVRDLLPGTVHTAIKHLLCDRRVDPRLRSADGVKLLDRRVDALVQRTSSLITVEQLLVTASRLRREAQHSRLLQVQALSTPEASESSQAPREEVHLGMTLPLERPDLIDGLFPGSRSADDTTDPDLQQPAIDEDDSPQETTELDLLRSLFQMAGESIEQGDAQLSAGDAVGPVHDRPIAADTGSEPLMPTSPSALQTWMEGLDAALTRRLRNLSHALNVELMRAGIISNLLPIQLLEAAISGQLPSEASHSNLLKLQLPLPLPAAGDPQAYETLCLLLRSSDLEFDQRSLRCCRGRLQQQRRELSTLVMKERHWQRRSSAREVQTHWWPNRPEIPPRP